MFHWYRYRYGSIGIGIGICMNHQPGIGIGMNVHSGIGIGIGMVVSVEHYPVLMPSFEEMCEVLSLYTILVYRHNNIPIELTVNFHKAVSYIAILSKKYYSLRLMSLLINT